MKGPRAIRMIGLLLVSGVLLSILAACTGGVGPSGTAGAAGQAGADGSDGADGRDGAEGAAGPLGPDGPGGKAGAEGEKGDSGPQIAAGITFADAVYSLEDAGGLTLTGWGFQADESVLITMKTNVRDEILMGPSASAFGAFEKTSTRFTLSPNTTPGVYTVSAEGTDGTIATTYLVIVASLK